MNTIDKIASRPMRYSNLYGDWLMGKSQPAPKGFKTVVKDTEPYTYNMKPEDILRYSNAISPEELWLGKGLPVHTEDMDYPTMAFNIPADLLGNKPSANLTAVEYGTPLITLGRTLQSLWEDEKDQRIKELAKIKPNYTQEDVNILKANLPVGTNIHEEAHFDDPRNISLYRPNFGNKGTFIYKKENEKHGGRQVYLNRADRELGGRLFNREFPAQMAEGEFLENLYKTLASRQTRKDNL